MAPSRPRVAYIVVAHKNPGQVARLVRRLAVPGTAFLIHIDRKAGAAVERAVREGTEGVEACHFLKPQRVHWAHFSQTEVALRALLALGDLGLDPGHTVLSTGQDYPIKSPEEIASRLSAESELAYVLHSSLPNMDWWPTQRGGLDRLERIYVRLPRRGLVKTPLRRRIPHDWKPYGGAANWMLGRPHRQHLQHLLRSDRRTIGYFRRTSNADELLFQTVLMNSPLRDSVVNDNLLFARWQDGANHPDLLGLGDLDEMLASPALFARKFDSERDPGVFDAIDEQLKLNSAEPLP
ncbi:MAG: beta-1,6-N-acetylglucosaminyltransferase [Solirubrobacterales bacterium]